MAQQPNQEPTRQMPKQATTSHDSKREWEQKDKPEGKEAARRNAKWNSLADRERDSLFQAYVRELPIEYRDLLEEYYEVLSK